MDIKTLSKKFCDYCIGIRGHSPTTIERYKNIIKHFAKLSGGIDEIEKVTTEELRTLFYNGRIVNNWSPNTFQSYYRTMTVFFRWCIKNGYYTKVNPMIDIEMPKLDKRLPSKLTKQQAMRILEVAYNYPYHNTFLRQRNYAIFSLFIFAGLRKSELLNLKYTDIDIDNLSIFIRQGKGNKDRVIPINDTLARSLSKYLVERKRLNKTCPEFFCNLNLNTGYKYTGLKRLVIQISKASGVKFHLHKLRHTFATLMLEGGCDIYSLSKMMGHSSINTTTIYLFASVEHLRAQMVKHPLSDL